MKPFVSNIILITFLLPICALAQETSEIQKEKILESITESIAGENDESIDLSGALDEMEELISHPININEATSEDLEKLQLLNSAQIENLLLYRKRTGQIYSLFEIRLIDGFNDELVNKLSPFVKILPPEEKEHPFIRHDITIRTQYIFEKAAGFIPNDENEKRFAGIEPKLYLKYIGEKDQQWNWAITGENDSGESFFSGNNKAGFDFYSGHLAWSGKKLVRQIIIGDFQVKTGQGLLFWSGYGGRKNVDGFGLRYLGQGIRPYSSSTEYGFFRGVATELETKRFSFLTFYSNRNADANITSFDTTGKPLIVSSIQESGYHRTENEITDKGSLNIQTIGFSAGYSGSRFRTSINGGYQHYDIPLEPEQHLYNQYYFKGKNNIGLSVDFQQALNKAIIYGESAISQSGGTALLVGADISPASEIGLTLLYRNYKKDFHTLGGNPFSEFGMAMNERGFYSCINFFAIPQITLSAYLDLYNSYWTKYLSSIPIKGNDCTVQANWIATRQLNFQVKYKHEIRNENSNFESPLKINSNRITNRIRLNAEWQLSEYLHLHFRTEWNTVVKEDSLLQGWMLLIDASAPFFNGKLTTTTRFAWYDTDHYSSGIRAYENDLPQCSSFPVYYLNGLRYYLNIGYRLSKTISLYLKISQTRLLADDTTIGNGDTQINRNHKSELKFQIRMKF